MVFRKKSRGDFETRFKQGYSHPRKGKTYQISWTAQLKPFTRLCKEKTKILQMEESLQVRLLRPMENDLQEVEKCQSHSKSDG